MKSTKRGSELGIPVDLPFRFDLDAEMCRARRAKLFSRLDPKPDLVVLGGVDHLAYFANFFVPQYIFQANNASAYLIITPDECTLVHDNLLEGFAAQAAVDHRQCATWYRGLEPAGERLALAVEETRKLVEKARPESIGVSLGRVPGNIYLGHIEKHGRSVAIDIDPVVRRMRIQKDDDELQLLRTCGAVVSRVMDHAWKTVKPGMTELELFDAMQVEANRLIGEPVRLYGDVVSGPRCEEVGGPPSDRKIRADELVLLDFSIVVHGYRADIAATRYMGTKPPNELWIRHKALVEALSEASTHLKVGSGAAVVEQAVKRVIADAGFAGKMPGHAGHGVGLMHPEPPFFVARSPESLLGREVVTIEPGIYERGICGMRIEHNYYVSDSGVERLTSHDVETLGLA